MRTIEYAFTMMARNHHTKLKCQSDASYDIRNEEYILGDRDSRWYPHKLLFCEYALRHAYFLWGYCTVDAGGIEDVSLRKQVQSPFTAYGKDDPKQYSAVQAMWACGW